MMDLEAEYVIAAGLAFNWGALLGWSAVAGAVDMSVCLPLYVGSVCWTLVYDTIYAHQVCCCFLVLDCVHFYLLKDKADDAPAGIRSTALLFGAQTRPIIAGFSASSLSLIALAGFMNAHGLPFYAGIGGAAFQLAKTVKTTDFESRESSWKGFVDCGKAGAWIWAGATVDYLVQVVSFVA
jgi:4-hydroxybenzoate polyprenyltransferase